MPKCVGGIIVGCKDQTSSRHLDGFPDGSNIESAVLMSGRSPPLCCTLTLIAMQGHLTKNKTNLFIFCLEIVMLFKEKSERT